MKTARRCRTIQTQVGDHVITQDDLAVAASRSPLRQAKREQRLISHGVQLPARAACHSPLPYPSTSNG